MIDPKVDTLLMVAEKQNFTKAAQALSLTQPAVSHHISQLEAELGAKLFLRRKSILEPTPEGEIAITYARRMKAMYEKMLIDIQDTGQRMTRLRVGLTHTAETNQVAEVLARYGSENPGVTITIITDIIKNLYDMIEHYELDLAVVEEAPRDSAFQYVMLDTDELVCVVCNDSPLAKQSMVTLDELAREKLILRLPKSGTSSLFISHLMSINRSIDEFDVILEVDNIATIKECIRRGLGISVLPRSTCMDELRKNKITVLPIEGMHMIREQVIVYRRDFIHREILQELMRLYHQGSQPKV